MKRPAYLADKVALERARRKAKLSHGPECICAFCLDAAKFQALREAALARNPGRSEAVPF